MKAPLSVAVAHPDVRTDLSTGSAVAIGVVSCCGPLVALLQTRWSCRWSRSRPGAAGGEPVLGVVGSSPRPGGRRGVRLVLGRLGDMYGKRRMLLVSVWLVLASLGARRARAELRRPARRPALQGVPVRGHRPGIIRCGRAPAGRVGSVGLMSSSLAGRRGGPTARRPVAEHAPAGGCCSRRSYGALVLVVLVPWLVPESRVRTGGRFDTVGALALRRARPAALGISKGGERGYSTATLGSLGAAAVARALGRYELRSGSPLVDLRVSARPAVRQGRTSPLRCSASRSSRL
ncbi:hypothetical protein HBB16_02280 [Pseudonocardia sp. MCCB 268]|nr:hypothetical protein [Pseudonocardia cytotoxica]